MKALNPMEFTNPHSGPKIRRLKIEEDGDPWKGKLRSKIRLKGLWLEQAGFKQGNYVRVECVAPGIIQLHSSDPKPMLDGI